MGCHPRPRSSGRGRACLWELAGKAIPAAYGQISMTALALEDSETLHATLGGALQRGRQHGMAAAIRFLPGTVFTDGEFLYQVVYGCQTLGRNPSGWVAALRTDYLDDPWSMPDGYRFTMLSWQGRPLDGVIITREPRTDRPLIIRLVAAAPRLALPG